MAVARLSASVLPIIAWYQGQVASIALVQLQATKSVKQMINLTRAQDEDAGEQENCTGKKIKDSGYYGQRGAQISSDGGPDVCAKLAHEAGYKYFIVGKSFFEGKCYVGTEEPGGGDSTSSALYDYYEAVCSTPGCSGGTCTVSEDPHIEVFDGALISLWQGGSTKSYTEEEAGDMWLVKTPSVSIQARYAPDVALGDRRLFARAVAVGGSFLKGNILVVGSSEDDTTWNGRSILTNEASEFQVKGLKGGTDAFRVRAERTYNSRLVQNLSVMNHGVNLELPSGIRMVFNRLRHHVNVAITMCKKESQDGLCGNFNGIAGDDSIEFQSLRLDPRVPADESLFTGLHFD